MYHRKLYEFDVRLLLVHALLVQKMHSYIIIVQYIVWHIHITLSVVIAAVNIILYVSEHRHNHKEIRYQYFILALHTFWFINRYICNIGIIVIVYAHIVYYIRYSSRHACRKIISLFNSFHILKYYYCRIIILCIHWCVLYGNILVKKKKKTFVTVYAYLCVITMTPYFGI